MRPIFWLNNARYVSFPQSLLPAFVAIALAFGQPGFSWGLSLLAVFGCVMAHFGFNILDDYFDFRNNAGKVREKLAGMGMRSRIAKCSYITSGEADMRQTRNAALVFLSLAAVSGAVIWYCRDLDYRLAVIVALALVLGYLQNNGRELAVTEAWQYVVMCLVGGAATIGILTAIVYLCKYRAAKTDPGSGADRRADMEGTLRALYESPDVRAAARAELDALDAEIASAKSEQMVEVIKEARRESAGKEKLRDRRALIYAFLFAGAMWVLMFVLNIAGVS